MVAKYENEDGDLNFEKSEMPVLDPSGDFEFSNVKYKEDDPEEIVYLEWDSYPYAVTHVVVKTGDGCETLEMDDELPGSDAPTGAASGSIDVDEDLGTKKAISHVSFFAYPYWQIDIANTESPYEIGNPTNFIEGGAGYKTGSAEWTVGGKPGFFTDYAFGVGVDGNGETLTAEFKLTAVPPKDEGEISVISAICPAYGELNASNWNDVVDTQEIYQEDAVVYGPDDADGMTLYTHEVDLPTV